MRMPIKLAGKIWGLCLIAHTDTDDNESLKSKSIRRSARQQAEKELELMGIHKSDVLFETDALDVAIKLKENSKP